MNILHINTTDSGGAAKALIRLQEGLIKLGINSKTLTLYHNSNSYKKEIYPFLNGHHTFWNKTKYAVSYRFDKYKKEKVVKEKSDNYEVISFAHTVYDLHNNPLVAEADLIHLHWVGNFLDYGSFFKKINKPVVWTLHDMNPFKGIFHYENDLNSNLDDFLDLEKKHLKVKKQALKGFDKLHVVCLNDWMKSCSKESEVLKKFPHYLIPNGLDLNIFKPTQKTTARKILNLPTDKKVILFIADSVTNKRKGFHYLKEALELFERQDFICAVVGSHDIQINDDRFITLDFINDDRLLNAVYTASDFCVVPSTEDNFPNTILEAMACGCPVIGFDTGGIPEMIRNNETGLLCENKNIGQLAQKISDLLENKALRVCMGLEGRKVAEKYYSNSLQAKKYLALYNSILNPSYKKINQKLMRI